jgi:hypothetical protein
MRVPCICGRQIEIPETAVMSEAARIAVGRRKTHKGAVPKPYHCRWCQAECTGRRGLAEHELNCAARPDGFAPVTDADLAQMAWLPDGQV